MTQQFIGICVFFILIIQVVKLAIYILDRGK